MKMVSCGVQKNTPPCPQSQMPQGCLLCGFHLSSYCGDTVVSVCVIAGGSSPSQLPVGPSPIILGAVVGQVGSPGLKLL